MNKLVVSWRTGRVLTPRYINILLKKLASETAKQFIDDSLNKINYVDFQRID